MLRVLGTKPIRMARMIILDNSVLVAFTEPTDSHHIRAKNILKTNVKNRFAHCETIAEYLVHPIRRGTAELSWDFLTGPYNNGNLGITVLDAPIPPNGEPWPIHLARVRAETRLKMPDAVVLATALAIGGKVATFDDGLAAAADSYSALFSE